MRIKIKDIPDNGLDWGVTFDRQFLKDALEGFDANIEASEGGSALHFTRLGENVFARGRLTGKITLPCSRCLGSTHMPVDVPLRVTFTPEDELAPDEDVTDDVELATHDRQFVVLDDLLREALILTVPMTPVCRESCRGLCQICGQDLNVAECGCGTQPTDPRFAALKDLKL